MRQFNNQLISVCVSECISADMDIKALCNVLEEFEDIKLLSMVLFFNN